MTQDDTPAPAVVDEVKAVNGEKTVIEDVSPSPPAPAPRPAPNAPRGAAAPDAYAVGVRVLKMAPAWLLFTAVCCSVLVLLLGWVRSSGEVEAVTLPPKRNDARATRRAPAAAGKAPAKAEAVAAVSTYPVTVSGPKSTAANDAPAQAGPAPAPAAAPKADEKVRVETPAPAAVEGGNFTAQVGSFRSQSEANERVSALRAAGFEAHVAAAELPGRGAWFRVQVGRFADRGEAAQAVAALRAKGAATDALVVPVQK